MPNGSYFFLDGFKSICSQGPSNRTQLKMCLQYYVELVSFRYSSPPVQLWENHFTSPGCGFPDSAAQIRMVAVLQTSIARA